MGSGVGLGGGECNAEWCVQGKILPFFIYCLGYLLVAILHSHFVVSVVNYFMRAN